MMVPKMLFRLQLKTREINKLAQKEVLVGCVWMWEIVLIQYSSISGSLSGDLVWDRYLCARALLGSSHLGCLMLLSVSILWAIFAFQIIYLFLTCYNLWSYVCIRKYLWAIYFAIPTIFYHSPWVFLWSLICVLTREGYAVQQNIITNVQLIFRMILFFSYFLRGHSVMPLQKGRPLMHLPFLEGWTDAWRNASLWSRARQLTYM